MIIKVSMGKAYVDFSAELLNYQNTVGPTTGLSFVFKSTKQFGSFPYDLLRPPATSTPGIYDFTVAYFDTPGDYFIETRLSCDSGIIVDVKQTMPVVDPPPVSTNATFEIKDGNWIVTVPELNGVTQAPPYQLSGTAAGGAVVHKDGQYFHTLADMVSSLLPSGVFDDPWNGPEVLPGLYEVFFTVKLPDGKTIIGPSSASFTKTVAPPVLTTRKNALVLTYAAAATATIDPPYFLRGTITLDGSPWLDLTPLNRSTDRSGVFEITTASPLVSGVYELDVSVVDSAGNSVPEMGHSKTSVTVVGPPREMLLPAEPVTSHRLTVEIGGHPVDVIEASLTMQEDWSPYIQGSVTLPILDLADADLYDPRTPVTVTLAATRVDVTTKSSQGLFPPTQTFALAVRAREINLADSVMTLELSSNEAFALDYVRTEQTDWVPPTRSIRAAVIYALSQIGATLEPGTADADLLPDAGIWKPGVTAWDYMENLVQAANLRLFANELGYWFLVNSADIFPEYIELSYLRDLTRSTEKIDRNVDSWADSVFIKYTHKDAAGDDVVEYSSAALPNHTKTLFLEYNTPKPVHGAAQAVLNRVSRKGLESEIAAVSNYFVKPTQTAFIRPPGRPAQVSRIRAVSWAWPDDEMRLTLADVTEGSVTAWVTQTVGKTWDDVPAGMAWPDYK